MFCCNGGIAFHNGKKKINYSNNNVYCNIIYKFLYPQNLWFRGYIGVTCHVTSQFVISLISHKPIHVLFWNFKYFLQNHCTIYHTKFYNSDLYFDKILTLFIIIKCKKNVPKFTFSVISLQPVQILSWNLKHCYTIKKLIHVPNNVTLTFILSKLFPFFDFEIVKKFMFP